MPSVSTRDSVIYRCTKMVPKLPPRGASIRYISLTFVGRSNTNIRGLVFKTKNYWMRAFVSAGTLVLHRRPPNQQNHQGTL